MTSTKTNSCCSSAPASTPQESSRCNAAGAITSHADQGMSQGQDASGTLGCAGRPDRGNCSLEASQVPVGETIEVSASEVTCCSAAAFDASQAVTPTVMPTGSKMVRYHISNMDCPTEERLIRNKIEPIEGISRLEFNLMSRVLTIHHELESSDRIAAALRDIGMKAEVLDDVGTSRGAVPAPAGLTSGQKVMLVISGATAAIAEVLAWTTHTDSSPLVVLFALVSIATGGIPTLRKGVIALRNLTLDINFLMSLAVIGAVVIGQWPEAAMVVFLFAVAELIESLSLTRARNAVHSLLKLAPDVANLRSPNGELREVPVEAVQVGDVLLVKPGDRIPLDGIVQGGESSVNQAPITGESVPVDKAAGDQVFAGTINERGVLEVRATSDSRNSTLAKIVRVIEETQSNQAPTQRFVDVFARYYTPAVVLLALSVALVPPLVFGGEFVPWLYKALVLLVIACPCALVISTPVTIVSGLTAATRMGILVKGGQFLETGYRLRAMAVDKTGTLTTGRPKVTEVATMSSLSSEDVLRIAGSLDMNSSHPLASAIVAASASSGAPMPVSSFESLPGRGVRGTVGGVAYHLGNQRLIRELGLITPAVEQVLGSLEEQGKTTVILADFASVLGVIAVADSVRPEAALAIDRLKQMGVTTVMLTGDNERTAQHVAKLTGIGTVLAQLLPERKLEEVAELQRQFGMVGMLGDGINDAPALAKADIGFAMGAAGSDTAIETADVALMNDDLTKLASFVSLSRSTHAILIQNIVLALGIKAVFFALALAGSATLWMAVFADVGASLLVVFNGLRLLKSSKAQS
ncbi:putative cadmium-transporting ATPase [Massilia sp. 9I]|nr:putative cadmium-transporting ATPase [Massilia sp. 9I]